MYQLEQSLFNAVYKSARSIVYKIVKILKLLVYLCEFCLRFKSQFLVLVSDNVINVPVRSNCKRNIAELSFQFMIFTFDNTFLNLSLASDFLRLNIDSLAALLHTKRVF